MVLHASATKAAVHSFFSSTFFQYSSMAIFSTNICLLLNFYSLIMLNTHCSWALSSSITLAWSVWSNSLGSVAKLRPTFLSAPTVALSDFASTLRTPSCSATTQRSKDQTNFIACVVSDTKLVDATLLCPTPAYSLAVWICSLRKLVYMALSACFCYCSKCSSSSAVVSLTLSPIFPKSPFVKVIGSSDDLEALVFFCYPSFSCSLCRFTWKGVLFKSPPPYSDCVSSFVCGEGDFWLLLEPCSSCSPCSLAVNSAFARAFSLVSFFLFSANYWTFNRALFSYFSADLLVLVDKSDAIR